MIHVIQIQNFQKHPKLLVKLDPHITTIVGPSDTGKSSIVRALGWVVFNSPSGQAFIRDGSPGCRVTVKTDKHSITRRRSKSVNHYEVDGKKLSAIRKGEVPDDVLESLRLDRLNFQLQHDSPLWLSESPGQVAKNLNEIVNLDLIDKVLTTLSRQLRSVDSELTVCQNRLGRAKSEKERLQWIEYAISDWEAVETTLGTLTRTQGDLASLSSLVESLDNTESKIERLENLVGPAATDLKELEVTSNEWKTAKVNISALKSLVREVDKAEELFRILKEQLTELEDEFDSIETCPLCGKAME